jgi:subtilisin-like proprotein convertase family protein
MYRSTRILTYTLAGLVCLLIAATAGADKGKPPLSLQTPVKALNEVMVLELEPIYPQLLLAEDEAKDEAGAKLLRYAVEAKLAVSPASYGTWEDLPDGGQLWRLRIYSPNATDLSFGFAGFQMPPGATLHVIGADGAYYRGPYSDRDHKPHRQLWTPVVPGERAIIELFLPHQATLAPELELMRVLRGYRDLFGKAIGVSKQGTCNNDVICPEGEPWRDEIRSVARISIPPGGFCTGTLINSTVGDYRNLFVSAYHCGINEQTALGMVFYWNYEAPQCGLLDGGSLDHAQTGATLLARRQDNDFALVELDDEPDPDFDVHYSGWDARPDTAPQGSVGIHHPQGAVKAISFNHDPLTTGMSCIGTSVTDTHWYVDDWEDGTTEKGSSGSGLWDSDTHYLIGYLSGGDASCDDIAYDCYGKLSVGWDGGAPGSRLKDWLDPFETGTLAVAGADPQPIVRFVSYTGYDSCLSGPGDLNQIWEPGETIRLTVDVRSRGPFTNLVGTLTSSDVEIIDGAATWPDIITPSTVTTDSPHFMIRIPETAECFSTVNLSIQVTTNEGGPFTIPISHEVGNAALPRVPVEIPDDGTLSSQMQVSEEVTLADLDVHVRINHTYVGDLTIQLRSPQWTTVTLLDRPGVPELTYGCNNNDLDVTFDDSSSFDPESHCNDGSEVSWYSGLAQPVEPLASINGESTVGTWTLTVKDGARDDYGILEDWSLIASPELSGQCAVCPGEPQPRRGRVSTDGEKDNPPSADCSKKGVFLQKPNPAEPKPKK